jgi:hypothetical protein
MYSLTFKRVSWQMRRSATGRDECVLVDDGWNDFGYNTLFRLIYFDKTAARNELGSLRIMKRGMDYGRVDVKERFRRLGKSYASLGTDQKFYENVVALGQEKVQELLECLRDASWNQDIYADFKDDPAFNASLMRGLGRSDLRRFAEIAHGHATPTPYRFEYIFPEPDGPVLSFEVTPHALPPTNIHTVIGRNGVGKTRLIKSLISLLCDGRDARPGTGKLRFHSPRDEQDGDGRFANLINVAFSAFDEIELPAAQGTKTGIRVSYIGLRRPAKLLSTAPKAPPAKHKTQLKSIPELTKEFLESLRMCLRSSKRGLWLSTVAILDSDPIFGSCNFAASQTSRTRR